MNAKLRMTKFSKKAKSVANWFVSLVWTKEIGFLVGLMGILLVVAVLLVWFNASRCFNTPHVLRSAFDCLFSPEKASENGLSMGLFFIVWLIGGGVLVSVMVSQYYKNKAGGFRRWPCLVENHVVVLGWDDGLLSELRRTASDGKHDCYIVTNQNVPELERMLESAGVENPYIYHGDYDDPKEWRDNLKIAKAVKVFIAGERDEAAHDARVTVLFGKIKDECKDSIPAIKVNIHDFGLAQKLIEKYPQTYENFHIIWADALWDKLELAKELEQFTLYVVGFGAMGKSVAISAIKRFSSVEIYVSDDDKDKLKEEQTRFKTQFNEYQNKITFISWSSSSEESCAANEQKECALDRIERLTNETAVIVVAKKRSEKGLFCMMDIISKLGNHNPENVRLALDQEIDGASVDPPIVLSIGRFDVKVFGMKEGCPDVAC